MADASAPQLKAHRGETSRVAQEACVTPRTAAIEACFGSHFPPELRDVYARSTRVDLKHSIFSSKDACDVADTLAAILELDRFAAPADFEELAGADQFLAAATTIVSTEPEYLSRTWCVLCCLPNLPPEFGRKLVLSDARTPELDAVFKRAGRAVLPDAFWRLPADETRHGLLRDFVNDSRLISKICGAKDPNEINRHLCEAQDVPRDLLRHLEVRLALLPAVRPRKLADLAGTCLFFPEIRKYFMWDRDATEQNLKGRRVHVAARGEELGKAINNALERSEFDAKLLLIGGDSGTGKTEGMLHSIALDPERQHFGLYIPSVPEFEALKSIGSLEEWNRKKEDDKRDVAVKLGKELIEHCLKGFPTPEEREPQTRVTVLIDELGSEKLFVQVLCRTVYSATFDAGTFLTALANAMNVGSVRLVCAGTGIQGVNAAPGSNQASYDIIDACKCQKTVKQTLLATLPDVWRSGINHPETLVAEYLGALAMNARCCAIMLDEIRRLTGCNPTDAMVQRLSLVALASLHATVLVRYKQLNGWSLTALEEYLKLMSDALVLSAYPLQKSLQEECDTLLTKGAMTDVATRNKAGALVAGIDRYHVAEAQRAIFAVLLTGVSVRKQCAEGCEDAVLDMVALQLAAARRRARMILMQYPRLPGADGRGHRTAKGWLTPKQLFWVLAQWTAGDDTAASALELVIDLLPTQLTTDCACGVHATCALTFFRDGTTGSPVTAEVLLHRGKTLVLRNAAGAAGPDGFILVPTIHWGRLTHVLEIAIQSKWFTSERGTLSRDEVHVELVKMGVATPRGIAARIVAAWKGASGITDALAYLRDLKKKNGNQGATGLAKMIERLSKPGLTALPRTELTEILTRHVTKRAVEASSVVGAFTRALMSQDGLDKVKITSRAIVAVFSNALPAEVKPQEVPEGVALVYVPNDNGVFQAWPIAFHGRRDDPRIESAAMPVRADGESK